MKQLLAFLLSSCLWFNAQSQFAPAAGQPGSTAIHADSSCLVDWALFCRVERGFKQINLPDSGRASVGEPENACGKPGNGLVSLGDAGRAILEFSPPIANGPGFDFAVFENAFNDSFLELAHVEVSSNGIDWVRFPSQSLTQTQTQTPAFGYTQPQRIHNLAGKYRSPYGTPFDLDELKDSNRIDLQWIVYVRIMDAVGSVDSSWGSRDASGRLINDPWPSPFPSSGFDLEAVGILHNALFWTGPYQPGSPFYSSREHRLEACPKTPGYLYASNGQIVAKKPAQVENWSLPALAPGVYFYRSPETETLRFSVR
ncbi:MAG: T9SS C-terminal target domain-containing protein [Bacteroidia bacterium]